MDSRRTVWMFFAWTASAAFAIAQSTPAAPAGQLHTLVAANRPGDLRRVEIAVQVGGDVKLVGEGGKSHTLPMSVVANVKYDEALLALDAAGRSKRNARYYDDTRAVIKIDKGGEKPTFGDARRLIVAERVEKAPCQLYSPAGPLTREELDLVDLPGGTLLLDDLLPGKPVAVGQPWKLSDDTVAALLCLDAVAWSDVEVVLGEVKDGVADVAAAGSVNGAVAGISTEIELKIKYKFDTSARRITNFAMLIKEKRAIGHVGPGLDTVAKVIIKVAPLAASQKLTRDVLAELPRTSNDQLLSLGFTPKGGRFHFDYDRRWYITSDDPKLAVLRLVDRGELVAQCNLSALEEVKKPISLVEFQKDVESSLGKNFGRFTSAAQAVNESGYAVFRVVVHGTVGELPIEWIYYLVQDRKGHRVSLAFTLDEGRRERFGEADRALISALKLTEPAVPTVARPVQTR